MTPHKSKSSWLKYGAFFADPEMPWRANFTLFKEKHRVETFSCVACCPVHLAEEVAGLFLNLSAELPKALAAKEGQKMLELSDSEKEHLSENS